MDTLVIQSGIKHGRVAELTRSRDDRLSVGRGYTNDLVLTDAHIAPQQLNFVRGDDGWHMTVLDFTNPVLLNDEPVVGEAAVVHSGDTVTVGRTRLHLFGAEHPVERTRKLVLSNWLARDTRSRFLPLAVLLGASLFDLLLTFFESSTDLKWVEVAYAELFAVVLILVWAGLWALAGRIFRHQQHFGLQLMATVFVSVLASVLVLVGDYLGAMFHSVAVTEVLSWITFFLVLVVLFRLNLIIATNIRDTTLVSIAMSFLVVGITYGFFNLGQSDEFQYAPEHSSTIKPPFAHVLDGTPADDYFREVSKRTQSGND